MWRALSAALVLGSMPACTGWFTTGSGSGVAENGCFASRNDEVRQRLKGACIGCHGQGSTKPFFSQLAGFEDLLVYDTKYVVAGKPDESLFITLLEGHGRGAFTQMPLSETYEEALAAKKATISLEELRDWVTNLPARGAGGSEPDAEAITVRRLTAEEMRQTLYDQLGLVPTDFGSVSAEGWLLDSHELGLQPPNDAPGIAYSYGNDYNAAARFEALGGPNTMQYRQRSKLLSPTSLQVLVQTSQAWCFKAVNKAGNTALLGALTLSTTSETRSTAIKDNIRRLHLRMLGEVASDADVEALYSELYLAYEPQGTDVAWAALCAAFIRDPLWLTF